VSGRRRRRAPRPGGSVVSYLPNAHIADRGLSHYAQMVWGHTVTCCPDLTQLFAHVAEVHPTFFAGVPRIWEILKAALEAGIESDPDEAQRAAVKKGIELGLRRVRLAQRDEPVPFELEEACRRAEEAVFSKLCERVGLERLDWCTIGAAPCPLEVLEFFAAIGIPICGGMGDVGDDLDHHARSKGQAGAGDRRTADPGRRGTPGGRRRAAGARRQ
jgi:long-chain acyl-CoA synthetase